MKKLFKITSLALVMLMLIATLAACGGPAKEPADAKAALEENGYSVSLSDGKGLEAIASMMGIDDLDAKIVATSKDDMDDYVVIYYFEDSADADTAWAKIQEEADDKDAEVVKKSGAMIYYGTEAAVKAAK